jgi:hypothetical protein
MVPSTSRLRGAFGLVKDSGKSATQPSNGPPCFRYSNEERQLSERRDWRRGIPLNVNTAAKGIGDRRPLLYLRLLTQRVSDPLAQICSHRSLIRRFGHSAQPPNCPIKVYSSSRAAPNSEYGWEKLFSERLYLAYRRNYGMLTYVARYHNIFGPEGTWTGGREKAPAAICRIFRGPLACAAQLR